MSRNAFRDVEPPLKGLGIGKTVPDKMKRGYNGKTEFTFIGTGGKTRKKFKIRGLITNIETKENMGGEYWEDCNQIMTIKFGSGKHYRFQIVTNHADEPQLWGEKEANAGEYACDEQGSGWPDKDESLDWCDCSEENGKLDFMYNCTC